MADKNLRASMLTEDLQQDRRMIQKKIQQRRRTQLRNSQKKAALAKSADAAGADGGGDGDADEWARNGGRNSNRSSKSDISDHDFIINRQQSIESVEREDYALALAMADEDFYNGDSFDEDLRNMRASHAHDEQLIGGRIEDGGDEGLEAMNQALTSPPVAWWAMRKQWQKRRGNMLNFVGLGGSSGVLLPAGEEEELMMDNGPDASYRSGRLMEETATVEAGVVGHPVMLEDPAAMGYDADAFRQNPYALVDNKNKRKRTPTVLFVSRDVLQKRKMTQMMYIIAALCVVFLFMFILQQRKLSHYAMVESPISLSAYLAGEQYMPRDDNDGGSGEDRKKVTMGDLGLEKFDKNHGIPQVEFGSIEVNPSDPLANEELANDPMVGNTPKQLPHEGGYAHVEGADRFELLKGVVVGWGVTPSEIFENHQSHQYRALHWLAHDDALHYTPDNDHWIKKIIQRYTLAVVYYSTNGDRWTNPFFFLSNYDECNWNRKYMGYFSGVGHCEGGYITAFALWNNNLSGGLPPEVGALTSLRTFSVFGNNLNVAPPKSLTNLKSLGRLYLQKNAFPKGTNINYLCPTSVSDFKSDCGRQGGVTCACCTQCGFNSKNDKGNMAELIM